MEKCVVDFLLVLFEVFFSRYGRVVHGFRKGRSCLTNLLEFLDKVTGCVDSGENVDVVFLDFAKAFDKVPFKRLMLKLESHGITGKVAQRIGEWLNNRTQ